MRVLVHPGESQGLGLGNARTGADPSQGNDPEARKENEDLVQTQDQGGEDQDPKHRELAFYNQNKHHLYL